MKILNLRVILLLFSFIFFTGLKDALAVIDLGSLEIEGEVRRPMIQYISSEAGKKKSMYHFLKDEFAINVNLVVDSKTFGAKNLMMMKKKKKQLISELLNEK